MREGLTPIHTGSLRPMYSWGEGLGMGAESPCVFRLHLRTGLHAELGCMQIRVQDATQKSAAVVVPTFPVFFEW